jgi:hypothetical protein
MLEFASEPDPIFGAIVDAALRETRDILFPYLPSAEPLSPEDLAGREEEYDALFPNLVPVFTWREALAMVDRLIAAKAAPELYHLNDYHWLVLYSALDLFCDLHNDKALGRDGKVGPYVIDRIDLDAFLDTYFFDADFLAGPGLLQAEEVQPDFYGYTRTAWKIAAGLRPSTEEQELERIDPQDSDMEAPEPRQKPWPTAGYVGPYPLREPE